MRTIPAGLVAAALSITAHASPADAAKAVAALDTQFQAAVKANDAAATSPAGIVRM